MDLSNIEPNSHKYNEEKETLELRRPEKVVTGSVKTKRRGIFKRFNDIFFTEDVGDVKKYLFYDVVVPQIKEGVADLINSAISMLLFGEATRRVKKPSGNSLGSRVNYGAYFSGGERKERMPSYGRSRIAHNFEDVVFDSRGEAELVLDNMIDILGRYDRVTVMDFYDLAGITSEFTDSKYGWTDLRGTKVSGSPSRGYSIDLPKCMALE